MFYFTAQAAFNMIKWYINQVVDSACRREIKKNIKAAKIKAKADAAHKVSVKFHRISENLKDDEEDSDDA